MNSSSSGSDSDDSYFDRLQAAALDDDGTVGPEETEISNQACVAQQFSGELETAKSEEELEARYFDMLQEAGELDSETVRPEGDPIWDLLLRRHVVSTRGDAAAKATHPERILVSGNELVARNSK